jgi:hypothetical protein
MGKLEYHGPMDRVNRATVAGFAALAFAFVLASGASAQINAAPPSVTSQGFGGRAINAAPPSVTSQGFGGRAINGAPPSVTSLGPRGYTPGSNPAYPNSHPTIAGTAPAQPADTHHHHNHDHDYWGVYGVPYYYGDNGYYDNGDSAPDPNQQQAAGPTIFDRNGTGYVPRPPATTAYNDPAPADPAAGDRSDPAPDQPETVLVFKDGHQVEVGNYAIVGTTLYDLSDGHRRKVALADLDLNATVKENDNRGIDFAVPSGAEAN